MPSQVIDLDDVTDLYELIARAKKVESYDVTDLYDYIENAKRKVTVIDLYSYIENAKKLESIPDYMYRIFNLRVTKGSFTEIIKKMLLTLENNNVHIVDIEATPNRVTLFVHIKMLGLRISGSDTVYYFEKPIEQLCRISVYKSSTYVYVRCSKIRPANVSPYNASVCLGNLSLDVRFSLQIIYRSIVNTLSVLMIPNIDNSDWGSKFSTFIKYSDEVKFKYNTREEIYNMISRKVAVHNVIVDKISIEDICKGNEKCKKYLEEHPELLLQKEIAPEGATKQQDYEIQINENDTHRIEQDDDDGDDNREHDDDEEDDETDDD